MKYKVQDIIGVNPIVAVPFHKDGAIDEVGFRNIVKFLAQTNIQGTTLMGVASEFPKLNDYEKDQLVDIYLSQNGQTLYKAISVTDHSTELAVQRAKRYETLGADALMLLPPFFLSPSQSEVERHIASVLDAVSIPVMVQYAPNETGFVITPRQLSELSQKHANAVFKIECNPPIEYTKEFLSYAPDATVLNGYAGLYMLDMLAIGGKGVMPGCSFAEIYVAIYNHTLKGEHAEAKTLHDALFKYIKTWMTHCEYIIQVEKTILYKRGIITSDYCRHPNYPLTATDLKQIDEFIDEFQLEIFDKE